MLEILSITGVIFVLISTGCVAVLLGIFSSADIRAFGKFSVSLALPALVLRAVSTRPLGKIADFGYLGAVLVGSLAVFTLGYIWSWRVAGEPALASTFSAMGMSCANSGFVGYPLLLIALPDIASTALALNMIVENLVMIPLGLVMAEYSRGGDVTGDRLARQIVLRLVRNPILVALMLGLVISSSGFALPDLIARPIDILASASAAVSLVVIGGTLAVLPLRAFSASVLSVAVGKLLLHPLAVALGLAGMSAVGLGVENKQLAAAAVVIAATPVMSIYPILAQQYGEEQSASMAMLVATGLSFITISVVLALTLH